MTLFYKKNVRQYPISFSENERIAFVSSLISLEKGHARDLADKNNIQSD
jgi:hypothetical protein